MGNHEGYECFLSFKTYIVIVNIDGLKSKGEWQELKLNSRVHCEKNDIIQNSLVGNGIINHTSGLVETVQPKAQVRGMLHRDRFLNFNIIASLKCTFGAFSERINEKMNRNLR